MKSLVCLYLAWILLGATDPAAADTFGSGASTFDIEFVTIGDPNNVALPVRGCNRIRVSSAKTRGPKNSQALFYFCNHFSYLRPLRLRELCV